MACENVRIKSLSHRPLEVKLPTKYQIELDHHHHEQLNHLDLLLRGGGAAHRADNRHTGRADGATCPHAVNSGQRD